MLRTREREVEIERLNGRASESREELKKAQKTYREELEFLKGQKDEIARKAKDVARGL